MDTTPYWNDFTYKRSILHFLHRLSVNKAVLPWRRCSGRREWRYYESLNGQKTRMKESSWHCLTLPHTHFLPSILTVTGGSTTYSGGTNFRLADALSDFSSNRLTVSVNALMFGSEVNAHLLWVLLCVTHLKPRGCLKLMFKKNQTRKVRRTCEYVLNDNGNTKLPVCGKTHWRRDICKERWLPSPEVAFHSYGGH